METSQVEGVTVMVLLNSMSQSRHFDPHGNMRECIRLNVSLRGEEEGPMGSVCLGCVLFLFKVLKESKYLCTLSSESCPL